MVENRSFEMSVGMLSPSSAAEVCEADARRYNTGAVLPQGAFYVQSIRAAQTADPRSKQTRPSGPARRSARVKIQGLATANWRKWSIRRKVLNGCISALWDDVRRELDENVIPGVGPPSVFQESEQSRAAALAALELQDGDIMRLCFSDVQRLPVGWRSHFPARFRSEIPACFPGCRSHSMTYS